MTCEGPYTVLNGVKIIFIDAVQIIIYVIIFVVPTKYRMDPSLQPNAKPNMKQDCFHKKKMNGIIKSHLVYKSNTTQMRVTYPSVRTVYS